VAFVIVTSIAGLGRQSCNPDRGILPFFLLALPVLMLNSALGLFIGRLIGSPRAAIPVAILFLLAYGAWLLIGAYRDPSFRLLSQLFVVVDGDLLNGQGLSPRVVAYRVSTLLYALGLCLWGLGAFPQARRAGLSAGRGGSSTAPIIGVLLVVVGVFIHGISAGDIHPGRSALEEDYTLQLKRGPLTLHADPRRVNHREAGAMLAEATLWLDRLRDRLGVEGKSEIHIYLHASNGDRAHYTGARHVDFAFPWKRELHIANVKVPHPTLGHELAHVLASELNDSLFQVPGRFAVFQNAGLTEGLAMAVTPEMVVRDGLTLKERAAAMRRAGHRLNLDGLFSMTGFWTQAPRRAYVMAGAVIDALLREKLDDEGRPDLSGIHRAYADGNLRKAFAEGKDPEAWVQQFEKSLDELDLPTDALTSAARQFERPSILDQTCDDDENAVRDRVLASANAGRFDEALKIAAEVEDPPSGKTLALLADTALRQDKVEKARSLLATRVSQKGERDERGQAQAEEALADLTWRVGQHRQAAVLYTRIDQKHLPPDHRRLVRAKAMLSEMAVARPGDQGVAQQAMHFLVPRGRDTDTTAALMALTRATETAGKGRGTPKEELAFAQYLLARQWLQRGAVEDGLWAMLGLTEDLTTLQEPYRHQVLLGVATGHARRGDTDVAMLGFSKLASQQERPAVRLDLRDRAERAKRMAQGLAASADSVDAGDRHLLGLGRSGGL
jgi:hypothetical protein